jgi:Transposase, Mutator family
VEIAVPRARLDTAEGKTSEWKSTALRAYQRRTKQADSLIAGAYLAGTNTRRVRRALAAVFGGAISKDTRAWSGRLTNQAHLDDRDRTSTNRPVAGERRAAVAGAPFGDKSSAKPPVSVHECCCCSPESSAENAFKRITAGCSQTEKLALYSGKANRLYQLD